MKKKTLLLGLISLVLASCGVNASSSSFVDGNSSEIISSEVDVSNSEIPSSNTSSSSDSIVETSSISSEDISSSESSGDSSEFSSSSSSSETSSISSSETLDSSSNSSIVDINPNAGSYYDSIDWNLTGADLKTSLYNLITITSPGWTYGELKSAYKSTDVRADGTVWDIYSDSTSYYLDDGFAGSYSKEGDGFNREHTIPQSIFNQASPMRSDAFHVYPSDAYVNGRRSNYPHGEVTGTVTYTSNDGCKLGYMSSGYTGLVFEPMDQYKGDFARTYFYFVTCYQNKLTSFDNWDGFSKDTYPSIAEPFLSTWIKWHEEDPVSEKELNRNEAIYSKQGNRNPFIDCPDAVELIWG